MNQTIISRTNQKLSQNEKIGNHTWAYHPQGQQQRQYFVDKNVFSPQIFLGTQWLTSTIKTKVTPKIQFLEIGIGCGVTAIEVALSCKCSVTGCDINQAAVDNTKINISKLNAFMQVYQSDMFDGLPDKKFDIIYWNYPFHPSQDKQLTILQKAVKDPSYRMLNKFLSTAQKHLTNDGIIFLGFSITMGDFKNLQNIAKGTNWKLAIEQKMPQSSMCLVKLNR